MADSFIDDLNELTSPAAGDWLVIEDVSATETKKLNWGVFGTAATVDIQTSQTDSTSGRLARNDAWGWGGDAITDGWGTGGRSRVNYQSTGGPLGSFVVGLKLNSAPSSGVAWVADLAFRDQRGFFRSYQNQDDPGTINWLELWHTGNTIVDGSGFIKEA